MTETEMKQKSLLENRRRHAGIFMVNRGFSMGDTVDASDVQDMLCAFVDLYCADLERRVESYKNIANEALMTNTTQVVLKGSSD